MCFERRSTIVNTLTGVGLAEVLQGASVVVDVSNSPSFEDKAVMEFFSHIHAQPSRVRGSSRCEALRRAVRGGNRAYTRESLPPSEERSGNANQGKTASARPDYALLHAREVSGSNDSERIRIA